MPHPTHRLDLLLVPTDLARGPERVSAAFEDLVAREVVASDGTPGVHGSWLVARGFGRVRADQRDRPGLYANQQGGFRASCPSCSDNAVPALHRALGRSEVEVQCGPCGWVGHVSELDYRPAAAWGQAALAIHDAGEAQLTPQARGWLDEALGAWCFVWRRP